MNTSRQALCLAARLAFANASRKASSEVVKEVPHPKFHKMKEIQKRFGVEDGTPVYLKAGLTDRLLYLSTCGIVFVGLGMSGKVFWDLTFKD